MLCVSAISQGELIDTEEVDDQNRMQITVHLPRISSGLFADLHSEIDMANTILVGAQWGDEGKGKIIDYLAKDASAIARYSGGNNAGHTVKVKNKIYIFCGLAQTSIFGTIRVPKATILILRLISPYISLPICPHSTKCQLFTCGFFTKIFNLVNVVRLLSIFS